jgi:hypothetical protein
LKENGAPSSEQTDEAGVIGTTVPPGVIPVNPMPFTNDDSIITAKVNRK